MREGARGYGPRPTLLNMRNSCKGVFSLHSLDFKVYFSRTKTNGVKFEVLVREYAQTVFGCFFSPGALITL